MWIPKNIKKTASGAASPAKPNVTFIRQEDVLSFPARDAGGVRLLGDIVPKPGAKMFTVYMTPSEQSRNFTSEGDEDKETILQKFEGWHPGDALDINEFIQNNLGVPFYVLADNCTDGYKRLYGTPCSPVKINVEQTSNNDGTGIQIVVEQKIGSQFVPAFYDGNMIYAAPFATSEEIAATEANGTQYLLAPDTAGKTVSFTSVEHKTGTYITLIGSGGSNPSKLVNGEIDTTNFVVILKDGNDWIALNGATITLQIIYDGINTFLVEVNRS